MADDKAMMLTIIRCYTELVRECGRWYATKLTLMPDIAFFCRYGEAVSHLRGTKQIFSECRSPIVIKFFQDHSDLDILKKIYFRNK